MDLRFEIWEQRLVVSEQPYVVAESQNYVEAQFLFSADWEGLGKTAFFGDYQVVVDTEGRCMIPHEALVAPSCEVYVVGSDAGSAKRITTNVAEFAVRATGDGAGELPAEPTPTVYEQILSAYVNLDGEAVKSVNGFEPDKDGNVHLETGTDDHAQLRNRDSANQHPMSAISGLEDTISGLETAIDGKQPAGNYQPAGDYLTAESDPTVPSWAKQPQKPSYTASEVGADAAGTAQRLFDSVEIPEVPEKLPNPQPITINGTRYDGSQAVNLTIQGGSGGGTSDHSDLTNRDAADQHPMSAITGLNAALAGKQPAGDYIEAETDPTVPAWAKAASKPTYTAAEVGALPDTTVIPTVPTTLPNPHALTFTGASTGTYDGSSALTINIPEGGSGGSGGGDGEWQYHTLTTTEDLEKLVMPAGEEWTEFDFRAIFPSNIKLKLWIVWGIPNEKYRRGEINPITAGANSNYYVHLELWGISEDRKQFSGWACGGGGGTTLNKPTGGTYWTAESCNVSLIPTDAGVVIPAGTQVYWRWR